ncbi:MAG: hypothetical protein ACXAEX_17270 [Promethearchaeota archaeon]|jgi:hypothetical protein
MSLFNIFRPEKSKEKLKELQVKLLFNPNYFGELKMLKLKKELGAYM